VGEILFGYLYDRARSSAFSTENHDIALFDNIAGNLEAKARPIGARALVELGKRYSPPGSLAAATHEGLAAEASRLGVEDIYLIGSDGRVAATTFEADRGLDLFSLGEDFRAFLQELIGKGRVASQSLSLSTRTGRITMYQFYSPPGSEVLIEISMSLRRLLSEALPGIAYDKALSQLLDLAPADGDGRLVWLTDIVTFGPGNYLNWSLLREGFSGELPAELLTEAIAKGEATRISGNREVFVKLADFDRKNVDFFNARFLEVFYIDLAPIRSFRFVCLAAALGIAALASMLSWIRARRSFTEQVTGRVEDIVRGLRETGAGSPDASPDPSSIDELSAISKGIYALVETLMGKNRELEGLSRRLEGEVREGSSREERLSKVLEEKNTLVREVHHRVRNNLQVLSSLVALQAQGIADTAVQHALGTILTRILGMSLVHDQLYESDTVTTIDVARYFGDLARSIVGMKARIDHRIAVKVEVKGIAIPPDVAIPLGLAVGELVANACDHAFPDRSSGEVEIRVERGLEELRVEVSDDGIGIGSARRGLGLKIVGALCEQLDGSFEIEGRSAGGSLALIRVHSRA